MSNSQTIFLAGGGTGGHLYPGIAVAEALRTEAPEIKCVFLCTSREIDRVILGPTGFEHIVQPIERPSRSIGGLLRFWKSWRETKDVVKQAIRQHRPVAAVGLGGYAAGIGVKLAAERKLPTLLINPDVIPGKANQYLMKYASAVCCQFEATREHVAAGLRDKLIVTGCPIRDDITKLPTRAEAAGRLGLDPLLNTLTITGASQGAATINAALPLALGKITLQGWQILHLSGRSNAEEVREAYRSQNLQARVIDFTPAMADIWAATDLAVSRSGASTCAELTACGIPSILLPYPFHKDQHQKLNAKVLEQAGAAICIDDQKEERKNVAKLQPVLEPLIHDAQKRKEMAGAARQLGRADAAHAVARALLKLITPG